VGELTKSINASRRSVLKALRKLRIEGRIGFARMRLGESRGKFNAHELFKNLACKEVVWTDGEALVKLLVSELDFCRQPQSVRKPLKRVLKQLWEQK